MRRSQSAIEYLTTYGWAILIIGIAAAVLYSLNLFNPYTYAPKASAGSCFVVRTNLSEYNFPYLSGACTNELPQYVAQLNGYTDYDISISDSNFPSSDSPVSIFAWVKTTQNTVFPFVFNYGAYGEVEEDWILGIYNGQVCSDSWGDHRCVSPFVANGTWNFIGFTYSGGTNTIVYINGISYVGVGSGVPNVQVGSGTIANIGGDQNNLFTGYIADVQIYNTSLSSNDVQTLYQEGIGGAPIDLNNLVGWWPLNGNPKDYSGNGNNGAATNVIYTSNWYNGYSAP
jgi:hypothetical protein